MLLLVLALICSEASEQSRGGLHMSDNSAVRHGLKKRHDATALHTRTGCGIEVHCKNKNKNENKK
jgi:hypothetical protein